MKLVTGLSYKYDYKGKWNTSAFVKHYLNHLEAYLDPNGGIDYQDFSNTTSYWGGGWASTYFWGQHTQLRLSYEYALRLPTSRELFGSGQLFGYQVIPESWYAANGGFYSNNGLMLLPPMALIIVGCIIWIHRSLNKDLQEK